MTTEELGSAIRNGIYDSLKGAIADTSYSESQLIDEAFILRSTFLAKNAEKIKKEYSLKPFYQTIDSIPIHEMDISTNTVIKSGICISYIKFPSIAPMFLDLGLEYIGMNNKDIQAKSFTVYYDDRHASHPFLASRIRKDPYVFVDMDSDANGLVTGFLYNMGKYKDKKYLTVRGIFDNPLKIDMEDCCTEILKDEFPAPLEMQGLIIQTLVNRYIELYRKANIPDFPNTLTDIKG